jgi:hypothetical protein
LGQNLHLIRLDKFRGFKRRLGIRLIAAAQELGGTKEVFSMRLLRSARLLVFALLMSVFPASSHAQIAISVNFAPPALPVYEQPICPQPNLMWTPGYWAYDNGYGDYYWVPGGGLLRRRQLRRRLPGNRVCRRHVAGRNLCLQYGRRQRKHRDHSQHVCQPVNHRNKHGIQPQPRGLQRRSRRRSA